MDTDQTEDGQGSSPQAAEIIERVAALRSAMADQACAAAMLPTGDPHVSEYPPAHWCSRAWMSGFSGSAGTLVVTAERAALWTDGRYYTQAGIQLAGTGIELKRAAEPDCPKPEAWLTDQLERGETVLCDGRQLSAAAGARIRDALARKDISLRLDLDPVAGIWDSRPPLPAVPAFVHDVAFCGESVDEKLARVRQVMKEKEATHYLVSALDAVAWLLNVRGGDVPWSPLVLAHVLVGLDGVDCYISDQVCGDAVCAHLAAAGVTCHPYDAVSDGIQGLGDETALLIDTDRVCAALRQAVPSACRVVEGADPVQTMKAIKNKTEMAHMRESNQRDGACFAQLLCWVDRELAAGRPVTELAAAAYIRELRATHEHSLGDSFETIAAYGEHAALMHYAVTPATDATLEKRGFFLVDSGGQYLDGTTDMTRTMACGELTEQQRRDYTLVLKGHISLCRAVFLRGATGPNLDILARGPLARVGLDYRCGTGHGVGFCLSVHEGPQCIRSGSSDVKLEPGMVLTNEPGVYREGEYGIRIENTLLVTEHMQTDCGQFLAFELLSYCPIDLRPVMPELLSAEEIEWLNRYHEDVRNRLSTRVDPETREWLDQLATQPLLAQGTSLRAAP